MFAPSQRKSSRAAREAAAARLRPCRRHQPGLDALEGRQLLSLVPGELAGNQGLPGSQELPVTASAPDGRSIVVWVDRGPSTSSPNKIEFRLFDKNGNPVTGPSGGDTVVAPSGANASDPSVAMDQNGNFVIAWEQGDNVLAQRYSVSGSPRGGVIQVAGSGLIETNPDVAMDRNGNFVVAYEEANFSTGARDVAAKRFLANGNFDKNISTLSSPFFGELRPAVAMASDGKFAIVMESSPNSGNNSFIFAVAYNPDASIRSLTTVVDGPTAEGSPDVAMRDNGEYTVVYEVAPSVGFNTNIKARRVSFAGTVFGEINIASTSDREFDPRIEMNRNGFGFVVAFDSFVGGASRVGVVEVKGNNFPIFTTSFAGINPALSLGPDGQYQLAYQRSVNGDNNVFRRRGTNLAN